MLPDLSFDELCLWATLWDVRLPPGCEGCGRPVYRLDAGYRLGRTWVTHPDPTWRHRADGTVACGAPR